MAVAVCCPQNFDPDTWELCQSRHITDEDLQKVAVELITHRVDKVKSCLSISPEDDPQGMCVDAESVLKMWKRKNKESKWTELIVCLNTLEHSALMKWMAQYLRVSSKIRGVNGVLEGSNDPQHANSALHPFPQPQLDPLQAIDDSDYQQDRFPVSFQEKCPPHISSQVSGEIPEKRYHGDHTPEDPNVEPQMIELEADFSNLQSGLLEALSRMQHASPLQTLVGELKVFLSQLCAEEKETIYYFDERIGEMKLCETCKGVFAFLTRYGAWTFLHYHLVEAVNQEFQLGCDDRIAVYKEKIVPFMEVTTLKDFLTVWNHSYEAPTPPEYDRLVVKVKAKWSTYTLARVAEVESYLTGEFKLKKLVLLLDDGTFGCIYLKWLVPSLVGEYMWRRMNESDWPKQLSCNIEELRIERIMKYDEIYKNSIEDLDGFWGSKANNLLSWDKPFEKVYDCQPDEGIIRWFTGGKLNVSVNCLDRHVKMFPEKTAIIWEREDETSERISYRQLLEMTCQVANVLKDKGVMKGDRVIIYMPAMPLAVASMLACARIGAVHCVVFSEFSAKELRERIVGTKAKVVITANEKVLGDRRVPLKENVDKALEEAKVETVLVAKRTSTVVAMSDHDVDLDEAMNAQPPVCEPEPMDSEDELFILYTSGTGKGSPTAVMHTQAGFLLYTTAVHKFMFNCQPDDVCGCMADLGWMAGHASVVYGPLCNGDTTLLFEGTPDLPDEGRYWRTVERHKITHFYSVPSVLKRLCRNGEKFVKDCDLSSLKIIAVAGEPIPPDVEEWYFKVIGKNRCLFLDTWSQTELAGIALIRWKSGDDQVPGRFPKETSFAFFGVDPYVEIPDPSQENERGELYLRKPLPSMGRTLNGSVASLKEAHFSMIKGLYRTYDLVKGKSTDKLQVIGRVDYAVRVKGVCWGVTEVETLVKQELKDEAIEDAMVFDYTISPGSGQAASACAIVPSNELLEESKQERLVCELQNVFKDLRVDPMPQEIIFMPNIPRTLSGKRAHHQLKTNVQHSLFQRSLAFGRNVIGQFVVFHTPHTIV